MNLLSQCIVMLAKKMSPLPLWS